MKHYYIDYTHLRNAHNNFEKLIDDLFLSHERIVVDENEMKEIVYEINDKVKYEHEHFFKRCKPIELSFFEKFGGDDMVLCTEASRLVFLSVKERK